MCPDPFLNSFSRFLKVQKRLDKMFNIQNCFIVSSKSGKPLYEILEKNWKNLILIAGGTGINPILRILKFHFEKYSTKNGKKTQKTTKTKDRE